MGFMEKDVQYGTWIEIDGNMGTEVVPADLVGDVEPFDGDADVDAFPAIREYVEASRIFSVTVRKGWGARLSAPGYMDCTEWSIFDTEEDAYAYLEDTYGDDDGSEEE